MPVEKAQTTKIGKPKEEPDHVIIQLASVDPQPAQSQGATQDVFSALKSSIHLG